MSDNTVVNFSELLDAFLWVSGADAFTEQEAYISRRTGHIHWTGTGEFGIEEDVPEDIGDPDLYVGVPSKKDLNLGRGLVFRFVDEHLADSYELVYEFFRRRGAYARFKDLLEKKGLLELWHDYESAATEQALREWCAEEGLQIAPDHEAPGLNR
jgi:hypothetical protein